MKSLKFVLLLFVVVAAVCSCNKEQLETSPETISTQAEHAGHENCILDGGPNATSERHRRLDMFPIKEGGQFNVFINTDCSNLYTQATIGAIDEYNALGGTSLFFTVVNSINDADIVVHCEDLGNGDCNGGVAENNERLDVFIHTGISTTDCFCDDNGAITQCDIQFIAMHEIGHAIGFGHTNSSFLPLIPGTPVDDFFSIFNSGGMPNALCAGLCEFTAEDINAIQILYPAAACDAPPASDISHTEQNSSIYLYAFDYSGISHQFRYRFNGGSWTQFSRTTSHYNTISNKQCGTYEVQLRQNCGGVWSGWSDVVSITTCGGVCPAPLASEITYSEHNSRVYIYAQDYNGQLHQFRYRFNNGSWVSFSATTSHYNTIQNKQCGIYKVQLRQLCGSTWSNWSPSKTIITCGLGFSDE